MSIGLQLIADQQFKHEKNEMEGKSYEHGFVMNISVAFQSRMWVSHPHIASHRCAQDHHALPEPYGTENCPVAPFYVAVPSERKEGSEYHQTSMEKKLAENLIKNTGLKYPSTNNRF